MRLYSLHRRFKRHLKKVIKNVEKVMLDYKLSYIYFFISTNSHIYIYMGLGSSNYKYTSLLML